MALFAGAGEGMYRRRLAPAGGVLGDEVQFVGAALRVRRDQHRTLRRVVAERARALVAACVCATRARYEQPQSSPRIVRMHHAA